jgi:hypothetical protein
MVESNSTPQSYQSLSNTLLCSTIRINASKGPRPATGHQKDRPRRRFEAIQEDDIRKANELHHQNREKRRAQLEEFSSNSDYLKALDMKKCLMEVQETLLRKLAAEENHIKKLAVVSGLSITNFDERVMELEEVIQSLQY